MAMDRLATLGIDCAAIATVDYASICRTALIHALFAILALLSPQSALMLHTRCGMALQRQRSRPMTEQARILPDLASKDREIEALRAKLAALESAKPNRLVPRVSAKGAISVYGMGQWPVTLYASQWDRLIAFVPELKAFMDANRSKLAVKANG